MILNKKQIEELILKSPPMITGYVDLETQLQPSGLDLTAGIVRQFESAGEIDFDNSQRQLSRLFEYPFFQDDHRTFLEQGVYSIIVNEKFRIPTHITAFTTSRSSVQSCGAFVPRGFFDPGFIGDGRVMLVVPNKHGIWLRPNARICQMEFHSIDETEAYNGIYQRKDGCDILAEEKEAMKYPEFLYPNNPNKEA